MRHVGGTVELDGKELPIGDSERMHGFRFKEVSIIPQYAMSAMNPTRRIGRMVAELLESRGVRFDGIRDELLRRLELVGLDPEVLDRYPIELSGGMKQRMVMVISTLLNPSLLVADEVTSALDVSNQKAVAEALVDFRDRDYVKSTILITHDLSLAYQVADSIIVMYAGKLAEKAPHRHPGARPPPPLHPDADRGPARGRGPLRHQAAQGHPREPAVPARPAQGLPVPGPLPAGLRQVR
jgi:peptide/nickel transport system ATP-binding protein